MLSIEKESAPMFEVVVSFQPLLVLGEVVDNKVHEPQHELIVLLVVFGKLGEAIVNEIANC